MKLLLVQLPTSHFGAKELVYPLGLSRLSSLVPDKYFKHVLDMNLYVDPWEKLHGVVKNVRPDITFLSFRNIDPLAGHQTSYISSLKTPVKMIRSMIPKAKIIVGGPAFTLFAKRLLREIPEIDYGISGEGEVVFQEMLKAPFELEKIPGLIWKNKGDIFQNRSWKKTDIDSLPMIDADSFRPRDYLEKNQYVAVMGVEGKRGCDLKCSYCTYPYLGGGQLRLRSPVKITDELEYLKKEYGVRLFHFTDSVVNRPADHFRAVCKEMLRRKLDIGWTGFFRETDLTSELLDLAISSGLVAVYFSGDALTDDGLKVLNKGMVKKDIINAAEITAKSGILTMCQFLINLPGETVDHFHEAAGTMDKLLEIHAPAGNLGAVIFNNIRLYPNAPITNRLIKSGRLSPETDLLFPVYYNPEKTSHFLHRLEAKCHEAGVFSRLSISKTG
ncbi:MAG TPA: B12 lower ligand biosynthesis radical SAM protein BzaD [Desulfobacteraceae bacterium]|nr:B12 lower ligand biosynthesis radical SAM protein BzaD [Desulfobacteraceae bacterium]